MIRAFCRGDRAAAVEAAADVRQDDDGSRVENERHSGQVSLGGLQQLWQRPVCRILSRVLPCSAADSQTLLIIMLRRRPTEQLYE